MLDGRHQNLLLKIAGATARLRRTCDEHQRPVFALPRV